MTLLKTIQISASILSADMANLTAVTEGLERDGLDMLHFDVMDGQFVPNITFGMPVLAAVDHCTDLFLDVHLMIADPIRYVKQFAEAGADLITFHIESNSDPAATIAAIHEAGVKAGIVLKPNTPWEEAIPYLEQVEVVLVMTVEPGFGGQSFLWDMVEKVKALRQYAQEHGLYLPDRGRRRHQRRNGSSCHRSRCGNSGHRQLPVPAGRSQGGDECHSGRSCRSIGTGQSINNI